MRFSPLIFAALIFAPALLASTANAADASDLKKITSEISRYENIKTKADAKAAKAARELASAKQKTVAVAAQVQEYEASLSRLEKELSDLEESGEKVRAELEHKSEQMQRLVAGLEILAKRPTEAMFTAPLAPTDTVKSAVLMKGTIPTLETAAKDLRAQLLKLSSLRIAISSKRSQIKMAHKGLTEKHAKLLKLLTTKKAEEKKFLSVSKVAKKKVAGLKSEAKTIEDLLKEIENKKRREAEAERRQMDLRKYVIDTTSPNAGFPLTDFEKSKGRLSVPVSGSIIARFNDVNQNGMHLKGIKIRARKAAQVISPYDGTVAFSGFMKGYGNMILIEHSSGYYTLLAGLGRNDIEEGQSLLAGEPIGTMPASAASPLYLEIRKDGKPINPLPWLALPS